MDNKTITAFLIIAGTMILFIILRNVNLWYWKINEHLENQKKIINLLEEIRFNTYKTKE